MKKILVLLYSDCHHFHMQTNGKYEKAGEKDLIIMFLELNPKVKWFSPQEMFLIGLV